MCSVYLTMYNFCCKPWAGVSKCMVQRVKSSFVTIPLLIDPPPQYQSVINNGSIPLDTSYDSQLAKYENEMNMRNMHSKYQVQNPCFL